MFRARVIRLRQLTVRAWLTAMVLSPICAGQAEGQRSWGDANTLVGGATAAAPFPASGSVSPFNPAANALRPPGAEVSLAVPMGIRDLAIQRAAGRLPVLGSVGSVTLGRLGFDRLVQHRLRVGVAGCTSFRQEGSRANLSVGIRATLDRFSGPGQRAALEQGLAAGGILSLSDSVRIGLVVGMQEAEVEGARSVDIHAAVALALGRHINVALGGSHATGGRGELETAVRLQSSWGGSLTASFGSGASGPGVAVGLRLDGALIRMAWLRTGPAGTTRYVSAAVMKPGAVDE